VSATPLPPPGNDVLATPADRWLVGTVLTLAGLVVIWEMWLAPIRPGGSWLALKALPLCLAVPGLLGGRTYTRQWLSLLLPLYLAEGVVRAWSEPGRVRALASGEIVLAALGFVLVLLVVRERRRAAAGAA